MDKQNNTNIEVVSYEKDKIQLLFNILNSTQFTGIAQAQAIAQISVILSEPIIDNKDKKEDIQNESGD